MFVAIGHVGAVSSNGTSVTTGGLTTTGASLLLAVVTTNTGTPGTLLDSLGNTWHGLTAKDNGTSQVQLWWCAPATVGVGQTFTVSGAAFPAISVAAFSGVNKSNPQDQENGATSMASATTAAGSVTPTQGNELIVVGAGSSTANVASIGSGYTLYDNQNFAGGTGDAAAVAYLIQTVAAASNPTVTFSSGAVPNSVVIATFRVAGPGMFLVFP